MSKFLAGEVRKGRKMYTVLRLRLCLSLSLSLSIRVRLLLLLLLLLLDLLSEMHLLSLTQRLRHAQTRSSAWWSRRVRGSGGGRRERRSGVGGRTAARRGRDGIGDHGVLLRHELRAPGSLRGRAGEFSCGSVGGGRRGGSAERVGEGTVARVRRALRTRQSRSAFPTASQREVALPRRERISGMRRDPAHAPAQAPLLILHIYPETLQVPTSF
jgi:hypothetical protein